MAGTITATVKNRIPLGGTKYLYLGTMTPDTSYAAGGDTIAGPAAPALTLPEKIDFFDIVGSAGFLVRWNPETSKVMVFDTGAASGEPFKEAAAAANLSANTFQYIAIGD